MKLSLNWLKDYVDIDMSSQKLAHLLTMTGLEVEGIEVSGQSLDSIVVSKILALKKHPQADRLFICEMDTGKDIVPVVCGAPNIQEGDMVPVALPGTRLPGEILVSEGLIRGERSMGMLLAEDEMGLTDDHTGIMKLSGAIEPGTELYSVFPFEDDVLDISLTPNRPDCSSVIGIAREVAVLTGQKVRLPEIEFEETGASITDIAGVDVKDTKGCPRYAAGMIQGVSLKQSPFWLRYRLHLSGIRPINNIVDISNYVLLEMGQPLHTFDYDKLKDHRIVVSRAKAGDIFLTLDDQPRTLNSEHLMICDGEKPIALAGIMGGINSEISAGSKNILIESACFDPVTIRRGSKALGLSTEASYRFERGIDIEGVQNALRRALMLTHQLAGGNVNKGIIDVYPKIYHSPVIELSVEKTNKFLGTSLTKERAVTYLEALEMEVQDLDNNSIRVTPPTFRVDITREVDLMEEVARLEGYERIAVTYPQIKTSDEADIPALVLRDRVSEIMIGLGFSEIITYNFTSPDSAERLGAKKDSRIRSFVELQNPLTIDQSVMRTSMLPGLLSTIRDNISHGERDLKLFEWGKIFLKNPKEELPDEKLSLAGIITGLYKPIEWCNEARETDFYDMKGTVELLLWHLGLKEVIFQRHEQEEPGYNPELSCGIYVSGSYLGNLGQVDDDVLKRFDLKLEKAYIFEIDIEPLLENLRKSSIKFEPFSYFPAVIRDISIIVDKKTESGLIRDIINRVGGKLVESVNVFDIYEGEKIGPSKKTISFRIFYRSKDATLDGNTVNRLHETVIDSIREETGGTLSEG
ncbi:phenylalanine--tRNA ligase subunit beta [Deltaproteobacteria bacterium]|nr:phenylalanine--tRNA ligase subunit beta [Deltaproteobacteria bacterium]